MSAAVRACARITRQSIRVSPVDAGAAHALARDLAASPSLAGTRDWRLPNGRDTLRYSKIQHPCAECPVPPATRRPARGRRAQPRGVDRTGSASPAVDSRPSLSARVHQKPQAYWARQREPLGYLCQPPSFLITAEHDNGVRPLIGDEQPPARRIKTEIARPVAVRRDYLVERECAR